MYGSVDINNKALIYNYIKALLFKTYPEPDLNLLYLILLHYTNISDIQHIKNIYLFIGFHFITFE